MLGREDRFKKGLGPPMYDTLRLQGCSGGCGLEFLEFIGIEPPPPPPRNPNSIYSRMTIGLWVV